MDARRSPDERRVCPACSHTRSSATNRAEKVMAVWFNADGSETHYCHHCQTRSPDRISVRTPTKRCKTSTLGDNSQTAQFLWGLSVPAGGTPAETYLRVGRGIDLFPPATTRYLKARGGHSHAMVTAFGVADECAPGVLAAPEQVRAVHITRLALGGLSRLEKRMLGPVSGLPLVLAPPNDGLGLVITEGIEDALSVHVGTGLGAWAAGSASHMPRLAEAVPNYIERVSVVADADLAGEKGASALARALLSRGFETNIVRLRHNG